MPLLSKLSVKNFKCFREKTVLNLDRANYIIGPNNAGKTILMGAIKTFFGPIPDVLPLDEELVNKTSFLSKKEGTNRADITIEFDLSFLNSATLGKKLKKYTKGQFLVVNKAITVATETRQVGITYEIGSYSFAPDEIPKDLGQFLGSIKVTYLHPQEGKELLRNAQKKLRQRLVSNWGRNAGNVTQSLNEIQAQWNDFKQKSTIYLSKALSENIQEMWPGSEAVISLPKDIRDIISISDISFKENPGSPDINLVLQGSGAQSTILYLTHFLLDSDKTLHTGEYHPVWLLEEPESFLHADLLVKLGKQLNSATWLANIQMFISTHSPILLATSHLVQDATTWTLVENHHIKTHKEVRSWTEKEIEEIGALMGDSNFPAYFQAAQDEKLIFLEDSKEITKEKFAEASLRVTKGLNGTPEVRRYLDVFLANPFLISREVFFIVDSDRGKEEIASYFEESKPIASLKGFRKFRVKDSENMYIILLPENFSSEDLFSEFNDHLEECVRSLWDQNWSMVSPPTALIQCAAKIKSKGTNIKDLESAKSFIKNMQEVKDLFWFKVKKFEYKINKDNAYAMARLTH